MSDKSTLQNDTEKLAKALQQYLALICLGKVNPEQQKEIRKHIQRLGIERVDTAFHYLMSDQNFIVQKNDKIKDYIKRTWELEKEILKTKESLFIPLDEDIEKYADKFTEANKGTDKDNKIEAIKEIPSISPENILSIKSSSKQDLLSVLHQEKAKERLKKLEKIKKAEEEIQNIQSEIKQMSKITEEKQNQERQTQNNQVEIPQEVQNKSDKQQTADVTISPENTVNIRKEETNIKHPVTNDDNIQIRISQTRKDIDTTQILGSCYNGQGDKIGSFVQNKQDTTGIEQTMITFTDKESAIIRRKEGKVVAVLGSKGEKLDCIQLDNAGQYISEIGRKIEAGEEINNEDLKKAKDFTNNGEQGVILTVLYPEQSLAISKLAKDRGIETEKTQENKNAKSSEEFILDKLLKDGNLTKEQENKLLEISIEVEQQRLNEKNKKGNYAEQLIDKIVKGDFLNQQQKDIALNAAIEAEKTENKGLKNITIEKTR